MSQSSLPAASVLPHATLASSPSVPGWRRRLWPGMIFALLALNVSVVSITAYIATSDRGFRVDPSYAGGGAARATSPALLGWRCELQIGTPAQGEHATPVRVQLSDRRGNPLDRCAVRVEAFHHGAPRRVLATGLAPSHTPGTLEGALPLDQPGQWHLIITVRRGDDLMVQSFDRSVSTLAR